MKTLSGKSLMLLAGLLVVSAAAAQAAPKKIREDARRKSPGFSTTVEYTGSLTGTMTIDGLRYRLAPNATVYVVGSGMASPGISVSGASLYLAGEKRGDVVTVSSVLVGPGAASDGSKRGHVGLARKGAPR